MEHLFPGDVAGAFAVVLVVAFVFAQQRTNFTYAKSYVQLRRRSRCSICVLGGIAEDSASKKQILQRKLHFLVAVSMAP